MKIHQVPSAAAEKRLLAIEGRGVAFPTRQVRQVERILANIRKNGDHALLGYVNQFDAPDLDAPGLKVSPEEMDQALDSLDPEFARTLELAASRVEDFHRRQAPRSWMTLDREGVFLGQLVRPVDAAGIYVPGGRAGSTPLVSSVLMGCIPARIAGVERIVVATPPREDGSVHPYLLAAAKRAGASEVYKAGSAWGIAALAFGTETIKKVDVIVGPGNIWVTIAKKLVAGSVGIDMIAGPSEVLVIADQGADPEQAAADLLSQAEHDPLASCILVCTRTSLARKVKKAVEEMLPKLSRREIAGKSMAKNAVAFVVPDLATAARVANRIAPEHLELLVEDPFLLLSSIRHAGAIFLGSWAPEPVGDYLAGPNHVLPTAGTARFSSALSVDHFIKKSSVIHYSRQALEEDAGSIIRLAETEGLTAHAESVRVRLKKEE
ncbi:MAG: histidinol dehydrogenase [Pseudomonadota bacterium]